MWVCELKVSKQIVSTFKFLSTMTPLPKLFFIACASVLRSALEHDKFCKRMGRFSGYALAFHQNDSVSIPVSGKFRMDASITSIAHW